jgi:hypothetical protein
MAFLASCESESPPAECDVPAQLRERAGSGAVDCGHVAIDGGIGSADACVTGAFRDGKPFFALYDEQGIDTFEMLGLASDGHGNVTLIRWRSVRLGDPDPNSKPEAFAERCVGPSIDTSPDRDAPYEPPIACERREGIGQSC